MLSFDTAKSRAILVGCNHRANGAFDSLYPAVKNNLWELGNLIRNKDIIGIEDIHLIEDRKNTEALEQIRELCPAGEQLSALFLYFCGHGLQGDGRSSPRDALHLVTHNTSSDQRTLTAISFGDVREIIANARPNYAFVILDCCFSGSALDQGAIRTATGSSNAFVIAACPDNRQTCWPPGKSNTAFTEVLLSVLRDGLGGDGARPTISMSDFFAEVKRRCKLQKYPTPVCQGTLDDHSVEFARNLAKVEKLTAPERELLVRIGFKEEQLSKLEDDQADDFVENLNEMVHKRVWEGTPAGKRLVAEICKLELFREFHHKDFGQHDITRQEYEIRLDMEGNALFRVLTILTPAAPIYSLWRATYGDAALTGFQQLALKFDSKPSSKYRAIPLLDEPKKKEIVFYLNPPLPAGADVSYDVIWKWPRSYRPLFKPPYTDRWAFRVRSATADLPHAITRVYLPAQAGTLRIQNKGGGGGELTANGELQEDGTLLYEWSIRELETLTRVILEFELTPRFVGPS